MHVQYRMGAWNAMATEFDNGEIHFFNGGSYTQTGITFNSGWYLINGPTLTMGIMSLILNCTILTDL